jgi:hypothetical protein
MHEPYQHLDEIDRIVQGFIDCTLPCTEWTHVAHLTVGLWHARHFPPEQALERVRQGIRRYNTSCGTENSATRGYHETITRFYMTTMEVYLKFVSEHLDWVAVTNRFIAQFGDRELPLRYYSRDLLMSSAARLDWVPPDLKPLD